MSISDSIVVMKDGEVQQIGHPQQVYDSPVNLFVAKFLGTPPINVFDGRAENGGLYIGDERVLELPDSLSGEVFVGVRPEGFILDENGPLSCKLEGVEIMGRDVSVISSNASAAAKIRSIISSDNRIDTASGSVRFSLKPSKVFLFDKTTEERISLEPSEV